MPGRGHPRVARPQCSDGDGNGVMTDGSRYPSTVLPCRIPYRRGTNADSRCSRNFVVNFDSSG